MSAPNTKTQMSSDIRTRAGEPFDDVVLARLVQQGIRDLARHSSAYANLVCHKPGARLAHQVVIGHVDRLSESGRVALTDLYRLTQTALTVSPGLDTNTFVDRVTGRYDPRRNRTSGSSE